MLAPSETGLVRMRETGEAEEREKLNWGIGLGQGMALSPSPGFNQYLEPVPRPCVGT